MGESQGAEIADMASEISIFKRSDPSRPRYGQLYKVFCIPEFRPYTSVFSSFDGEPVSLSPLSFCGTGGLGVGANVDFSLILAPRNQKNTGTGTAMAATQPRSVPAQLMPMPLNM